MNNKIKVSLLVNVNLLKLKEESEKINNLLGMYKPILNTFKAYNNVYVNHLLIREISQKFEFNDNYFQIIYKSNGDSPISETHRLSIWSGSYPLIKVYNCENLNLIVSGKFKFDTFKNLLEEKQNYYRSQLERMNQEITNGLTNLQNYNKLITQANKLFDNFSDKFVEIFSDEFQKTKFNDNTGGF